jgi:transposase
MHKLTFSNARELNPSTFEAILLLLRALLCKAKRIHVIIYNIKQKGRMCKNELFHYVFMVFHYYFSF